MKWHHGVILFEVECLTRAIYCDKNMKWYFLDVWLRLTPAKWNPTVHFNQPIRWWNQAKWQSDHCCGQSGHHGPHYVRSDVQIMTGVTDRCDHIMTHGAGGRSARHFILSRPSGSSRNVFFSCWVLVAIFFFTNLEYVFKKEHISQFCLIALCAFCFL